MQHWAMVPCRFYSTFISCNINPFLGAVPILYLKTPEKLWFSGVFRGYKMLILARNEFRN